MKQLVLLLLPSFGRRVAEEDSAAERADGVGGAAAGNLIPTAVAVGLVVCRPTQIEGGQFDRRHEQQMAELFELTAPAADVATGAAGVNRLLDLGVNRVHPLRQAGDGLGRGDGVTQDELLGFGEAQAADSTILAKGLLSPTMPPD